MLYTIDIRPASSRLREGAVPCILNYATPGQPAFKHGALNHGPRVIVQTSTCPAQELPRCPTCGKTFLTIGGDRLQRAT